MRAVLRALGLGLLGVALGLGSLAAVVFAIAAPHDERYGAWEGTALVGVVPANPWKRVAVAARGLVGLPRSETIYLTVRSDEDGRPFEPGCTYRINGRTLPARWWSLTPYNAAWELIPNPDGVYSIGSHNVSLEAQGRFALRMRAAAAGPAELPLGDEPGTFVVLRLYHPEPGVAERLAEIEWPRVERERCS